MPKVIYMYLCGICEKRLPHFIKYKAHTSRVHTWISQWFFGKKKLILFYKKNNFMRINHWKFIHHKSHLKPFLSYIPCIMCREYFSIIFNVKKCSIYSIKYDIFAWKKFFFIFLILGTWSQPSSLCRDQDWL